MADCYLHIKPVCHVIMLVIFYCFSNCAILLDFFHDAKAKQFIITCNFLRRKPVTCMQFTASLSAVFRSQKRTKLLHTSGACPGDGSYYY